MKLKILIIGILACSCSFFSEAQTSHFNFQRKISSVPASGWYAIEIVPEMQLHLSPMFSDCRIYKISNPDTVEVPYVQKILADQLTEETLDVTIINKSTKDGNLYVTFELPKDERVNYMHLEFSEQNFDGRVMIEGSQDQKEWFLLTDRQRIISIHDQEVNYDYTTIRFPLTNYRYLRIQVIANRTLNFVSGQIKRTETKPGVANLIPLKWATDIDKRRKITASEIIFTHTQRVNTIAIELKNEGDYYRPFTLEALTDSTKSQTGWQFYYKKIVSGYLTSTDTNVFSFPPVVTKKLRLTIKNFDNPPLSISQIKAEGPKSLLITKLSEGEYFLFYGNSSIGNPIYDLLHFEKNIPDNPPSLSLGSEEDIRIIGAKTDPLFQRKIWLWVVMGIVISLLGFFTMRMMKGTKN